MNFVKFNIYSASPDSERFALPAMLKHCKFHAIFMFRLCILRRKLIQYPLHTFYT